MKKIFSILLALLLLLGCNRDLNNSQEDTESKVETYYKNKVEFIGGASDVGNLLNIMEFGEWGGYTIELKTSSEPYGLILNYKEDSKNKDDFNLDMEKKSIYLLALIDNLSYVEIKTPSYSHKTTKEEADEKLGDDVKEFGKSIDKFKELTEII